MAAVLTRGDQVPHFQVRTIDGLTFTYASIWQHQNLLLVTLAGGASSPGYVSELLAHGRAFRERNTACVITPDVVAWLPGAAALVADRWGEIVHVASAAEDASLPAADDLLGWIDYVEGRCPECEGEAR